MLFLLACQNAAVPPTTCSGDVTAAFTPVTEPDPRLNGDEVWVEEEGATVEQSGPDAVISGPGSAMLTTLVDRGIETTITGSLAGSGAGRVELRHILDNGRVEVLDSQDFDGDTTIALSGTPTANGDVVGLGVVLLQGGVVEVSDVAVTATRWAAVEATPSASAPVRLGFLIHIEDDNELLTDATKWERRARVFEGLSQTLAAHGARLTIQPDISFVRASDTHDPAWLGARADEGLAWSVHLHDESNGEEAFEAAARDARRGFSDLGIDAVDFNGGFALGMWDTLGRIGLSSVTAFKDATTQGGLPEPHVQPWRIADGVSSADIAAFTTHAPEGPMVYLPGDANREPDHRRFPDYAARELSQVFAAARPGYVNTWYFMFHVDGFTDGEADADAYLDGPFAEDLAWYDSFLSDYADPLVAAGALTYDTPDTMRDAWLDWEADCAASKTEE